MRFDIILADPPWKYNSRKAGRAGKNKTKFGGGAEKHYRLMEDREILGLGELVKSVAKENCCLFLWIPKPLLPLGIKVVKEWGFRHATVAFEWVKVRKDLKALIYGPGYYTASNQEFLLLGVKGSMPPVEKMLGSIHFHPRLRHSQKPESFQDSIERMYPGMERLEMFARRRREGWVCVGDEIDGMDIREALSGLAG